MKIQSTIITTLAIAAAAAVPPPVAAGSPLLSGYGAPGAGEQQLVGAELVGGGEGNGRSRTEGGSARSTGKEPRSGETHRIGSSAGGAGGSSGGGSPGGGSSGGGSSASGSGGASAGSGSPARGQGGSSSGGVGGQPAGTSNGEASGGVSPGGTQSSAAGAGRVGHLPAATSASSTLGLSGAQLLLIAIVAGALILVALVTRRLAALQRGGESVDRGHMKIGESG